MFRFMHGARELDQPIFVAGSRFTVAVLVIITQRSRSAHSLSCKDTMRWKVTHAQRPCLLEAAIVIRRESL